MQQDEKTPLLTSSNEERSRELQKDEGSADDASPPQKSATFGQLFREATCGDVLLMILGSMAALVHGAAWPVLMIFFGDMTDVFIAGSGNTSMPNITNTTDFDPYDEYSSEMTKYTIRYVYVGAAAFAASYIQISTWHTSCERQVHRIRKKFFKSIMRQEIAWFDVHKSGELTTRLADDLERMREGLGDKVSYAIQFFSAFLSGFIIGFYKGWKLALVMMSLTPLLAVCGAFMAKLITSFSTREQTAYAEAGAVAEEVLSCIRTVTSFNGQKQDLKRYEDTLEKSKQMGLKKSWVSGMGLGTTFFVMFGAYALAFWYGSEQVKDWFNDPSTGMSGGTVLTVFFCVLIGTFSIGNITPHVTSIATAKGAAAKLIEIIDNEPSIDANSTAGRPQLDPRGRIELRGVNFTYPTRKDVQVLRDFNITVEPGQTVALVGPSGCGKSTVINLIQRFYDTDSGQVFIDGYDVKELNIRALRKNIGVVSQEPILFGLTIQENILMGRPDASTEDMVLAAKSANCHDFISALPQGYNTLVGERGAQLSGGQKQRVAIARALIRNPRILLLDEATSALDTASERTVQKALDQARLGRTTIVIAHRLSTVQNADVIYVVEDGKIVESGKHSDLMAQQGVYHQLVTVQMIIEDGEDDKEQDEDSTVSDIPRKRTLSSNTSSPTKRQLSHQMSRQISKKPEGGKVKEEVKDIEKETVERGTFAAMMRENKPELPFIILGCLGTSLNGVSMPVFAVFFGEMINVFINKGENSVFWSMMFLVLGASQFVANLVQAVAFGHSGEKMTMRLRLKTFRAFLRQDMAYYDDPKHATGALTTRLATDATLVKTATGIRIGVLLQTVVGMAAALTIAFVYGWQLALVVLGCIPLMAAGGAIQTKIFMGNQKKDNVELEAAGKTASEAIENIRTVQGLTREPEFYNNYSKSLIRPYRTNIKMAQGLGLAGGFSQGIVFFVYAGAFRFGAYMVTLGEMSPNNVFKVFFAIAFTAMVAGQASSFIGEYSKAATSAGIIFKTVGTVPAIDVFSNKGIDLSKLSGLVEFHDVQFHYPMRPDVPVLKGVSIRVEPGQTVALVGPSGCGKSTIVSLLQRFYDPDQGQICLDGKDVRDINMIRLRSLVSVVSQEPILFDCSIRDNITYGLDTPAAMDEIIAAARNANAHEFITNLPEGYDTVVGEKGTQLSGGQKQRVAIARALVRNPYILLLDEATSALDTESEQIVQGALDRAQEGRTCIVIAHRLSTIQNADVIYVLDAGKVVEYGSHQQLLNKKGVYATLVSGQTLAK